MIYRGFILLVFTILAHQFTSCGAYSLSGVSIPDNVKTFEAPFFQNVATQVEVGIARDYTLALQDLIQDQSSLSLVTNNGDYIYQGEITRYNISPITATANNTASQNRLTIGINLRFTNTKIPEESFEKGYSFFHDYPAATILQGAALDEALDVIFTQITQEMFNDTLAKW